MYFISDDNSFKKMCLLNNVRDSKKSFIENRFWLSIKADVVTMIRQDKNYYLIPQGLQNDAIDDISQDVLFAVYKRMESFINNVNSSQAGSRTNWLKRIVHRKICNYLNHNQQIFNPTLSVEQDTFSEHPLVEVIENTIDSSVSNDDIKFFAKYYVFFTSFEFRIKSKIMYFYKDIEITRYKRGKNGGASGKHNCLENLNGKSLFELRNKAIGDLQEYVGFAIPLKYINDIKDSITFELMRTRKRECIGKTIFNMTSSYAKEESSRINDEFSVYEDDIELLSNELIEEVVNIESLMSNKI